MLLDYIRFFTLYCLVCVCVCACVRACVRACVLACVRACVVRPCIGIKKYSCCISSFFFCVYNNIFCNYRYMIMANDMYMNIEMWVKK